MRILGLLTAACLLASVGCDHSQLPLTSLTKETTTESTAKNGSGHLASEDSRLLPPVTCMKDEHGNAIKLIVCNHMAPVYADSTGVEVLRRSNLQEKFFLFGSHGDRLHVGTNPRLKGEGWLESTDVYTTSSVQVLRFNVDTRPIREAVLGYSGESDLIGFVKGRSVEPSLIESKLADNGGSNNWMPILQSKTVTVGGSSFQIMELGAWTLSNRDTSTDPIKMNPDELQNTMNQWRIVLCIDATSSMHLVWRTVQNKLKDIIRKTLSDSTFTVEIAIVAYRDNDTESKWTQRASPFTGDLNQLEKWVNSIRPVGGGDWEERMF